MMKNTLYLFVTLLLLTLATANRCGKEYGYCPDGQCCSKHGYCGKSEPYCGRGCQSDFGYCNNRKTNPVKKVVKTKTVIKYASKVKISPATEEVDFSKKLISKIDYFVDDEEIKSKVKTSAADKIEEESEEEEVVLDASETKVDEEEDSGYEDEAGENESNKTNANEISEEENEAAATGINEVETDAEIGEEEDNKTNANEISEEESEASATGISEVETEINDGNDGMSNSNEITEDDSYKIIDDEVNNEINDEIVTETETGSDSEDETETPFDGEVTEVTETETIPDAEEVTITEYITETETLEITTDVYSVPTASTKMVPTSVVTVTSTVIIPKIITTEEVSSSEVIVPTTTKQPPMISTKQPPTLTTKGLPTITKQPPVLTTKGLPTITKQPPVLTTKGLPTITKQPPVLTTKGLPTITKQPPTVGTKGLPTITKQPPTLSTKGLPTIITIRATKTIPIVSKQVPTSTPVSTIEEEDIETPVELTETSTVPVATATTTTTTTQTQAPSGECSTEIFGMAQSFNAFFFEDFTGISSDVQGRLAAKGAVDISGGYQSGAYTYDPVAHSKISNHNCDDDHMKGDVQFAIVAGSVKFHDNGEILNGGVAYQDSVDIPSTIKETIEGHNCSIEQTSFIDFEKEKQSLTALSQKVGNMNENAKVTKESGKLVVDLVPGQKIFVITIENLSQIQEIVINENGVNIDEITIVFNITSDNVTFTGFDTSKLHQYDTRILWNAPNAKKIEIKNFRIEGSLLAPFADIEGNNGNIQGQMIANSFKGNLEIDWVPFYGCL